MPCENIKNGYIHSTVILNYDNFQNLTMNEKRKNLRDQLVDYFKEENPGTGRREESTRHIYCVSNSNNNTVYLQRPAMLNKGFDFTVNSSNIDFFAPTERNNQRITKTPRHDSLFFPIDYLMNNNNIVFNRFMLAIEQIFLCMDTEVIENDYADILNIIINYSPIDNINLSIDIKTLLYTIQWLFIEQDITYWNFTGRYMLYKGLSERYTILTRHLPE